MSFDGASPYWNSSDERTMRQRNRVRKKIQQRNPSETTGNIHAVHGAHGKGDHEASGPAESGEKSSVVVQRLSSIQLPQVTSIQSRCAVIKLCPPDWESCEVEVNPEECRYELLLSDKGKEAKYKSVFCGDATEITLQDLKPGSEYYVRALAFLTKDVKGALTEPVSFRTLTSEPDAPQPPKLMNRTKASLKLKWNAACDNGSKITAYSLEWDQGLEDGSFVEAYSGLVRQYEAAHLKSSTCYTFRLAAVSDAGKSQWSEAASFFTSGSAPPQPCPPSLSEQLVAQLTLSWVKRPGDEEFLLQMEDESTGHGFIPVYNGPNSSCPVRELRRNAQFKFRLSAKNEEGQSKWSDVVTFCTLPDVPAAPQRPRVRGRVSSHSFAIVWEPPTDDGGADITKYIVELDAGQGYEVVCEGSDMEHQFERLIPGHQYHARVACCSAGGQSKFSESCVVTMEPVVPGQCQSPRLQGKPKATALHLRWSPPVNDGGSPVTQFAVQMTSPDKITREVYRGPGQDCVVAGLLPGKLHLFQVRGFNKVGAGQWSDTLEVTSGAAVPDAPSSPRVVCRSPHAASVAWEEPISNGAAIGEYRLECSSCADGQEFSQLYAGLKLTFEVKGLTPATSYSFRVQAVNAAGPSQYSPIACCQTPPSCPGPVAPVRWQTVGPTSVMLLWQLPTTNGSDVTSYNICLSDKEVLSVEAVTEYTLENLLPDTTYRVQVRAVNSVGAGPYGSTTKVTTRPLPPSPPHLECVSTTCSSAKLKWGEGRNPQQLTYTLEMARQEGQFQVVYTGSAHTHRVNRLAASTSYQFRILASNDSGPGPYSDPLPLSTPRDPPPAVKALHVTKVKDTCCEVQWAECRGHDADTLTYVLQLRDPQSSSHEFRQVYRGRDTCYALQGLKPGTHYQLRAFTMQESGDQASGPFSPITYFTTTTTAATTQPLPRADGDSKGTTSKLTEERKPWTDEQWAFVIVMALVVVAVVVAVVAQQVLAYVRDSSGSAVSAESSASSSGVHTS